MVSHYSIDFKYTAVKLYLKIESIRKAIKPVRACHQRWRCCYTTTRQSRYGFHYY